MIEGYRHTGMVVQNLEKSRVFYEQVLGFRFWKQAVETGEFIAAVVGIPGVVLEWVKLKAPDNTTLELLQYHSHPDREPGPQLQPSNRIGCSHLAFTVKDLVQTYRILLEQGIHCNSGPKTSPDGTVKVLYCHDPDGAIIELVEEIGIN